MIDRCRCEHDAVLEPTGDEVALVPWPTDGRAEQLKRAGLACFEVIREANFEKRLAYCFVTAMRLLVRDGCDPQAVHRTMMELKEYRAGCAEDMPLIQVYQ